MTRHLYYTSLLTYARIKMRLVIAVEKKKKDLPTYPPIKLWVGGQQT